jgi:hypothetical protein
MKIENLNLNINKKPNENQPIIMTKNSDSQYNNSQYNQSNNKYRTTLSLTQKSLYK